MGRHGAAEPVPRRHFPTVRLFAITADSGLGEGACDESFLDGLSSRHRTGGAGRGWSQQCAGACRPRLRYGLRPGWLRLLARTVPPRQGGRESIEQSNMVERAIVPVAPFAFQISRSYSAGTVRADLPCVRSTSLASQRLWCSLAQFTSTAPSPIASNAPSIPSVPI